MVSHEFSIYAPNVVNPRRLWQYSVVPYIQRYPSRAASLVYDDVDSVLHIGVTRET